MYLKADKVTYLSSVCYGAVDGGVLFLLSIGEGQARADIPVMEAIQAEGRSVCFVLQTPSDSAKMAANYREGLLVHGLVKGSGVSLFLEEVFKGDVRWLRLVPGSAHGQVSATHEGLVNEVIVTVQGRRPSQGLRSMNGLATFSLYDNMVSGTPVRL